MDLIEKNIPEAKLSEVTLLSYPYFLFYLTHPRVEITSEMTQFEEQSKNLKELIETLKLKHTENLLKIYLLSPKKAVVNSAN